MSSDTKHAERVAEATEGKWLAAEKTAEELEKTVTSSVSTCTLTEPRAQSLPFKYQYTPYPEFSCGQGIGDAPPHRESRAPAKIVPASVGFQYDRLSLYVRTNLLTS